LGWCENVAEVLNMMIQSELARKQGIGSVLFAQRVLDHLNSGGGGDNI
jgi:hypothetical protein